MLALSSARATAFCAPRVQPRLAAPMPLAPARGELVIVAAVPKKKTSKSKKNIRKAAWKKEVLPYVDQALFKARMALKEGTRESKDKDMVSGAGPAAPEGEAQ